MSIEVAWKAFEDAFKEYGDGRAANEGRLQAQLRGLVAEPAGLGRLADMVKKRKERTTSYKRLLRLTIEAALEAWKRRTDRNPIASARLALAIADVTEIEEAAHRSAIELLYWADWEAFVRLIHGELRAYGRGDAAEWLQSTYRLPIPRAEWLPLFRRLRELPGDQALGGRLAQTVTRLEHAAGETGGRPSVAVAREVERDEPVRPAEPSLASAAIPHVAGHPPARVEGTHWGGEQATPPSGVSTVGPEQQKPTPGHILSSPTTEVGDTQSLPGGVGARKGGGHGEGPVPDPEPGEERSTPAREATRAKPRKGRKEKDEIPAVASADLEICLREVNGMIIGLLRGRDQERSELLVQCAQTQKENDRLKVEAAGLGEKVNDLVERLERARRVEEEAAERFRQTEARLAEREDAARRANERADRLERDLNKALADLEAEERRARDDVHRANLLRDQAVQGFRYEIRERVLPFLTEATDDGGSAEGLTPEQERLRLRLRQILDALHDLGVEAD